MALSTKIKNEIKKNIQVSKSLEWATSLLQEMNDEVNLQKVLQIKKDYEKEAFNIMRQNNISTIDVFPTKNSCVTLTLS